MTHPHRWQPGSRFRLDHADSELHEHRTLRGVVVSVDELADLATVQVDGVPLDVVCPLEHLQPETEEIAA